MTDFVTRLDAELHAAAVRQERRGRVGAVAMPRVRIAVGNLPTAALATVLLGLAAAVSALILPLSPHESTAGELPATLQGVWRAPPTELRLYEAGSTRCINLGLGSSGPCYALGDAASRVATDWGGVSLAGHTLLLHSRQGLGTGIYRWRLQEGRLRLSKVTDGSRERVRSLVAMPLAFSEAPNRHPGVPVGWSSQTLASPRFGYSVRAPHYWSIDTSGRADRLSGDATRHALPEMSVTAGRPRAGASSDCPRYGVRRLFVGGTNVSVSVYRDCGAPNLQSAGFVHGGREYTATWRGNARRPEDDYARFDAILKSLEFAP